MEVHLLLTHVTFYSAIRKTWFVLAQCTARHQEESFNLRSKNKIPIANWQSAIDSALIAYQTSGSAQRSSCEPRQAGNGATVATTACVAGKSEVW